MGFENLTNYINAGEQETESSNFGYATMSDAEAEEACEGSVEERCIGHMVFGWWGCCYVAP